MREPSLGRARGAQRCFNCGSYNHAMGECPQPRNAEAISAGLAGMRAAGLVDGERPASRCASASAGLQALVHRCLQLCSGTWLFLFLHVRLGAVFGNVLTTP